MGWMNLTNRPLVQLTLAVGTVFSCILGCRALCRPPAVDHLSESWTAAALTFAAIIMVLLNPTLKSSSGDSTLGEVRQLGDHPRHFSEMKNWRRSVSNTYPISLLIALFHPPALADSLAQQPADDSQSSSLAGQ